MNRHLSIFALAALLSLPAAAQSGPCSGGAPDPRFTLTYSSKEGGYRLTFEQLDAHTYSSPIVSFAGKTITVSQGPLDVPLPPLAAALPCHSETVKLGALEGGTYDVLWRFTLPSPLPDGAPIVLASYRYSFTLAARCVTPIFTPRLALQRTAAGSWRLRYDHSFLGYAPRFGTPAASLSGQSITILQPVDDFPPAGGEVYPPPPPSPFCDSEEVELPALGAGTYSVSVVYAVTRPSSPPVQYAGGSAAGFIIGPSLDVQCTTTRTFSTFPTMPVAGAKATLTSTMMTTADYAGTDIAQKGHTLVLTDRLQEAQAAARCVSATAVAGPLDAGTYTVQWQVAGVAGSDFFFPLRVAAWSRHHAAR